MSVQRTAFVLGLLAAAGAAAAETSRFLAFCEIVGQDEVVGYVRNESGRTLQVEGPVKFTFHRSMSMSRDEIQAIGAGFVRPGETVAVARIRLPNPRAQGEQCRLELSGAIGEGQPPPP